MTTPIAPASEAQRKGWHDALQGHLSGIQDRYKSVAMTNPSPAVRAQARLMGSYMGNVAGKAKAAFEAGGAPSIDGHMAVITAAENHLAKLGAAETPQAS
jgi:hypothetical protein